MDSKKLLLYGAGAFILYKIFGKAQAAKNLKAYFQGVSFAKGSGLVPTIFANIKFLNASDSSLNIRSIAGDLLINGKQVATFSQLSDFNISGQNCW